MGADSDGMVTSCITNGNHLLTAGKFEAEGGGFMIRTNVLRLMVAVSSFGTLVAVVGAGTKWSLDVSWLW